MPESRPPGGINRLWIGLVATIPLHIILLPVTILLWSVATCTGGLDEWCETAGIYPFLFIGGVQLVYMIPAILAAWLTGRTGLMQGLLIGAALTLTLNAACWGLIGLFLIGISAS